MHTYIHTIASTAQQEVAAVFLGEIILLPSGEIEVVQRHRHALDVRMQQHAAQHLGESRLTTTLPYIHSYFHMSTRSNVSTAILAITISNNILTKSYI
jgi:hypothetical protein